ncbi:V-set domain-containing T-cell activation inhibitor 1 isoform X2 [Ictalurus punctatus]|uniref:V-set domain-containing T-cell activation inhibitor 1 isoform X2 n=1 Tax=Ictalurus punctatus TaxID=7998 RepID=A0A9F7RHL8_ICTPU|nr:V-set domain-containing T-cell activation inhibitor 1 isoform X2 [Ictalurus punctatus]
MSFCAMMLIKIPAALLIFLGISLSISSPLKDTQVTCLFHEDCILPCSFIPTGAVVIHWYKQQIPVHSYYYNKDQFGLQNKHFSGRTCLFNLQIPQGNASLVLRKVKLQDRGRYKCYTSTRKVNQETFVNLNVKALIQMVKIDIIEEKVICLAQNIYPAPQLVWSTEPPTDLGSLHNHTRNTADSKGLFTIESTISILGNISQHAYFCSVVSGDRSQVWTASVKQQDKLVGEEGNTLLIPCMLPQLQYNFTLTWTFIRTLEPIMILIYDSRSRRITNSWEKKAELNIHAQMGNGSLTLFNPESSAHTGLYTCTLSSFQFKHQVHTWVNITVQVTGENEKACQQLWWGTAASGFIFLLIISMTLSRCFRYRDQQRTHIHAGIGRQRNMRTHNSGD